MLQARSFVSAMTDTGCQSCLASLSVVKKLRLSVRDLIPVDIEMHAANNDSIHILGATILRLTGKDDRGEEQSTRQMVYVTDSTNKLFISREACVDQGIILDTFPTMGGATENKSINSVGATDNPKSQWECQYPRWTKSPPAPLLLFPATEANREKLQQYLRDYYASSAFNTCEHQTLPLMDSLPLRLMINPNTIPTAHHSPIPVPLHWQDAVKAGLSPNRRNRYMVPSHGHLRQTEWLTQKDN